MDISNLDKTIGIFTLIFLIKVYISKQFWPIVYSLKKFWLIGVSIILINCFGNSKLQDALKKGIIAFIIALFASHDLVAAPFYLILILSYYGITT
jgi:hypothetical protein